MQVWMLRTAGYVSTGHAFFQMLKGLMENTKHL